MIGIGAAGARGMNGTLRPATARTRSGCDRRELPDHVRAPVVADEDRRLLAELSRAARSGRSHSVTTS